jgi:tetratricopeptide (TPR) repeat protein
LLKQQDLARAIAILEAGLREAATTNDLLLEVIANLELALALIESGTSEALRKSKPLLISAGKKLKACPECYAQKAYLLYCQGLWSLRRAKFADGVKFLELAQKSPDLEPGLDILLRCTLAQYHADRGEFEQALSLLERSLDRSEADHDRALILKHLGSVYLLMDDYEKAAGYFEQCLDLALQIEHKYLRIEAMTGLSNTAIAQSEYETAGMLIQERLQLIEEPGDLYWAAYAYVDLSEAMLGAGEINHAHACIKSEVIPRFQ